MEHVPTASLSNQFWFSVCLSLCLSESSERFHNVRAYVIDMSVPSRHRESTGGYIYQIPHVCTDVSISENIPCSSLAGMIDRS